MRRSLPLILFFGLAIATSSARAAVTADNTQILFNPKHGFPAQGGPAVKAAYFPAGAATLVGGRGEVVLGDGAVGLGVGSYSLSSELLADQFGVRRELGLAYGGVVMDFSFANRKLFYLNIACLVGPGQAYSVSRLTGATRDYANFMVVEPELSVMLNTTESLRLGLGVSYREAIGNDIDRVLGSSMNGFALSFTLMYGKI